MTTNHLSSEELSALLDGLLPARAAEEARGHLAGCARCRDALAELSAQDERLRRSLSHDPGEAYFASFAERVGERIRAAERGTPVSAGEAERRAPARLGLPRTLAWVGAVAAVAVGVGIAFLASRETPVGPLRDREAIERAERAGPPPREDFAAPPKAARPTPVPPPSQEMRAMNEPAPGAGSPQAPVPSVGSTQATAPAPPAGSAQAPAPAARLAQPLNDGAAARDQRSRDEKLAAPPPVAAGRAQEVRRTASGEEVPIPTVGAPSPQAAAPPPAPVEPGKGVTVKKRAIATPMQSKEKPAADQSAVKPTQLDAVGPAESALELAPATSQLCGEVRDPSGRPVAGASVVVVEGQATARTGRDGRFCVSAPAGERTLSVMAIGFQPARETVRAGAGALPVRVTLQPISVLGGKVMNLGSLSRAPSAALPDSLRARVERAEALSSAAGRDRSASGWDRAADAWAALVPALPVGTSHSAARLQLAAARYHAWELDPGAERRAAAAAALDAYLADAPAGAERDQARGWRARLGR